MKTEVGILHVDGDGYDFFDITVYTKKGVKHKHIRLERDELEALRRKLENMATR